MLYVGPTVAVYKARNKFYEPVGKEYSHFAEGRTKTPYIPERGYPISAEVIEDDPIHFERLPDDDHTTAYYLDKVYTQYQVDQLLNKNT